MITGPEGSGKTHLALTASELGPTAYIDTDRNAEGVLHKFKDRDLWQAHIQSGAAMFLKETSGTVEYKAEFEKLRSAYYEALGDPKIKVIIIDNNTEVWELIRLRFFGKLTTLQRNFGPPNADMRKLLQDAKERNDINLVLIHKLTNEYLNDSATGNKIPAGFKEVPSIVQLIVNCWRRDGKFGLTIGKSTHNPRLVGAELVEPMSTFPMLMNLIHGDET